MGSLSVEVLDLRKQVVFLWCRTLKGKWSYTSGYARPLKASGLSEEVTLTD